jgi:hypothetical protein
MDNTSDEDKCGAVAGIERQCPLGVLFRVFEMAFLVRLGGFVQLVLGSHFAHKRTAGARGDKESQDRQGADPGLRQSHFSGSVWVKVTPHFAASAGASLAE